jgi:hypothetical protein
MAMPRIWRSIDHLAVRRSVLPVYFELVTQNGVQKRAINPLRQPSPKNCPGSPDDGFLTLVRNDRELDLSFLSVEYRVRDISLREHVLTFAEFGDRLFRPRPSQERPWDRTSPV